MLQQNNIRKNLPVGSTVFVHILSQHHCPLYIQNIAMDKAENTTSMNEIKDLLLP